MLFELLCDIVLAMEKNIDNPTVVSIDAANRETAEVIVNPDPEKINTLAKVLELLDASKALDNIGEADATAARSNRDRDAS